MENDINKIISQEIEELERKRYVLNMCIALTGVVNSISLVVLLSFSKPGQTIIEIILAITNYMLIKNVIDLIKVVNKETQKIYNWRT